MEDYIKVLSGREYDYQLRLVSIDANNRAAPWHLIAMDELLS